MIRRALVLSTLLFGFTHLACAQTVVTPTASALDETTNTTPHTAVMQRRIALHLDRVTLKAALRTVALNANVSITYSANVVPASREVSLVTDHISVQDALHVLLDGTGLEAVPVAAGTITIRPIGGSVLFAALHQQGTATLSGAVTDSGTGAAIPQVTVHIDGTSLSVKSGSDGLYKIPNIAAGEYRVTARRVGYLAMTRTITLADGESKKLDFDLNPPATQLNEVVTTALGEQRRYQVGNVISTINVDSIAPNAPVTRVTDLISGRAPGVEVMESSGLVGSGEDIRIRGQSSMLLQSDPIIIVDGIREDNTAGGNVVNYSYSPGPMRLNDLDFSQIATIDILKGPTATTEYGTDAANGVIVITTKRGIAGRPQWTASGTYNAMDVPTDFPIYYWNWAHLTNGTGTPMIERWSFYPCSLAPFSGVPSLTSGQCVVDSTTAFNPEDHASTTEYGTGPDSKYNVSVGGGTEAIRYYFAGGLQGAVGAVHLPSAFNSQATALGYPESAIHPNGLSQTSLRGNNTYRLSPTVDLQTNVAYMSTSQGTPVTASNEIGTGYPAIDDSAYGYGYGPNYDGNSPLSTLATQTSEKTEQWTGGATANIRPTSWLATRITAGIDHGAQTEEYQYLPVVGIVNYGDTALGQIQMEQTTNDIYSLDLGGNATATLFHHIRAMTSFGIQFTEISTGGLGVSAYRLSGSEFTLDGASETGVSQLAGQSKTGGAYIEENFGLGDRCYIPVALRLDAASGFGASVAGGSAQYPKYGFTCLILTGNTTLRVRASYGAAGQQPPYGAAFQQYYYESVGFGNNPATTVVDYDQPGNATLEPERSEEFEGGFDIGLWGGRLQGEVTAYTKSTQHALYELDLGEDFNYAGYYENIGDVKNVGFETALTAEVVQSRLMTWSLTGNVSLNANKLVRLASGILTTDAGGGERFAAGYPLYGYWGQETSFADVNHDGIIELNELTVSNNISYQGVSLPPQETSMSSSMGFWQNIVNVNALFDFRSGFKQYFVDPQSSLEGANIPASPLWQQAEVIAMNTEDPLLSTNYYTASYLRFRELSVAYSLPRRWSRAVRVNTLSMVGAIRNVALWTKFPYGDPEVSNGATVSTNGASGISSVNNDVRSTSSSATPLTRDWTLRLNIGW